MSKLSFFILLIAIGIAIIPIYVKFDYFKKLIGDKEMDPNSEDKKRYILTNVNKTMEEEFAVNETYLQYERKTMEKIKELEKEKKLFEEFEANIDDMHKKEFEEKELKDLTDLIDRYILTEN